MRPITVDGLPVLGHVPELADLLELAQALIAGDSRRTAVAKRAARGWSWEPHQHEHVQWLLAHRPLRRDDLPSGHPISDHHLGQARLVAVAIPGTNEWPDWPRMNLDIRPARLAAFPGYWHRGFVRSSQPIWDSLRRALTTHDRVAVVGYSAGGPLAQLTVARLAAKARARDLVAAVAFAAPRVGSRAAIRELDLLLGVAPRVQRLGLGADLVPGLVPAGLYHHAWPLVHIGSDGKARRRRRWWRELRRSIGPRGIQTLRDHQWPRIHAWTQRIRQTPEPAE